jgi:hypothetical protein
MVSLTFAPRPARVTLNGFFEPGETLTPQEAADRAKVLPRPRRRDGFDWSPVSVWELLLVFAHMDSFSRTVSTYSRRCRDGGPSLFRSLRSTRKRTESILAQMSLKTSR